MLRTHKFWACRFATSRLVFIFQTHFYYIQ